MVTPLLRSGDLKVSHPAGRSAKGIFTTTIAILLFTIFLACCVLPAAPEYPSDTSSICDTWCHLPRQLSPFHHTVSTLSPLLSLLRCIYSLPVDTHYSMRPLHRERTLLPNTLCLSLPATAHPLLLIFNAQVAETASPSGCLPYLSSVSNGLAFSSPTHLLPPTIPLVRENSTLRHNPLHPFLLLDNLKHTTTNIPLLHKRPIPQSSISLLWVPPSRSLAVLLVPSLSSYYNASSHCFADGLSPAILASQATILDLFCYKGPLELTHPHSIGGGRGSTPYPLLFRACLRARIRQ